MIIRPQSCGPRAESDYGRRRAERSTTGVDGADQVKLGGRNTKPEGGKRAPDYVRSGKPLVSVHRVQMDSGRSKLHDLLIPSGGLLHVLFLSTDRTLSEHWRCARVGPTAVCN